MPNKKCKRCERELPLTSFNKTTYGRARPECRECQREYNREYHITNPLKKREAALRPYGLTVEQYDVMWAAQAGLCLLCKRPETAQEYRTGGTKKLAVDHCHVTGAVRGLLCQDCNHGIGKLQESPHLLRRAADYLEARIPSSA